MKKTNVNNATKTLATLIAAATCFGTMNITTGLFGYAIPIKY